MPSFPMIGMALQFNWHTDEGQGGLTIMKTVFRIGIALYLLALADMLFVSTGLSRLQTLSHFALSCY